MKQEFISTSTEETHKIGETFAKEIPSGSIVCLYGDLGFGKTTFVQGVARGLGIGQRIISPTFVIIRRYEVKIKDQRLKIKNTNQKLKMFYHIDLYRMQTLQELESLGLQEIFQDTGAIVLIEWPEKLGELLPEKRIEIKFGYVEENERRIMIKNFNF